jgi:hypothetical protein
MRGAGRMFVPLAVLTASIRRLCERSTACNYGRGQPDRQRAPDPLRRIHTFTHP